MPKVQKKLTLKMGTSAATGTPESTLERHLDVKDLSRLLAEGWKMVQTSPPDEEGNATILLERDEP